MAFKGIIFDPPDTMDFGLVVDSSDQIPDRGDCLFQDFDYIAIVDDVACFTQKEINGRLYEIYFVSYAWHSSDLKHRVLKRSLTIYYDLGKAYSL